MRMVVVIAVDFKIKLTQLHIVCEMIAEMDGVSSTIRVTFSWRGHNTVGTYCRQFHIAYIAIGIARA